MLDKSLPWGATPILESSGLKLPWVKAREQLNEAEADNILNASSKYFSKRKFPSQWFHEKALRQIHCDMFEHVWDWAGVYYQGPLRNIGVKFFQIPVQVRELCQDVLFWLGNKADLTFLEQSARIHFRLAQIHPFQNGNGRHARFIADLYLHSLFGQKPQWPERILLSENNSRKEYIQSLKRADQGDYSLLIHLTQKYGGKNPLLSDLLTLPFFRKNFSIPKLIETVQNLLSFGSDVNELSLNGHHPLQLAIRKNLSEIAFLLIQRGAAPNQKDKSGLSPFQVAVSMGNKQIADLLLSYGAHPVIPPGVGYANHYNMYRNLPPN